MVKVSKPILKSAHSPLWGNCAAKTAFDLIILVMSQSYTHLGVNAQSTLSSLAAHSQ